MPFCDASVGLRERGASKGRSIESSNSFSRTAMSSFALGSSLASRCAGEEGIGDGSSLARFDFLPGSSTCNPDPVPVRDCGSTPELLGPASSSRSLRFQRWRTTGRSGMMGGGGELLGERRVD